jgi:hypothetical protein
MLQTPTNMLQTPLLYLVEWFWFHAARLQVDDEALHLLDTFNVLGTTGT